jgi:hypothetical protein
MMHHGGVLLSEVMMQGLLAFGTLLELVCVHLSLSVQLGSKGTSGTGAYLVASQTGKSASEET